MLLAKVTIQACDKELELTLGSGTLPGDAIAGEWSLGVYHKALGKDYGDQPKDAVAVWFPWASKLEYDVLLGLP